MDKKQQILKKYHWIKVGGKNSTLIKERTERQKQKRERDREREGYSYT